MEPTIQQKYEDALAKHGQRVLTAPETLAISSYNVYIQETLQNVKRYSRILRTTIEPEFTPLPSYGQLMSLRDFMYFVGSAFFNDPDGYGLYVRKDKVSNIEIYPDDMLHGAIRTDFESIIWFNK